MSPGESDKGIKEEVEEVRSFVRTIPGGWKTTTYVIAVIMSLFHIWVNTFGVMPGIYRNAVHLGFVLILVFFLYPMSKRHPQKFITLDVILAFLSAIVALYILLFEEELHLERASVPILRDYLFAALALILLLYGTYRAVGWFIPALSLLFVFYALFLGNIIPGTFHYRGVALTRFLYRMYLTDEGIFGIVCTVSSTYVILFILFGAFLLKSGAGDFIIRLAQAVAGHRVGGPAKIAVVASGFMGSISGSAVANTVATGSFTIPLMKKVGYRAHFAGAVEAAASTGGQLMPPIMGAGAFIMAQWTGISYLKIIAVATIPAIMYFASVAFFVHIEALKQRILPTPKETLPRLGAVLKEGFQFTIPVIILVLLLLRGFTPTYAACIGIGSIIVVSWFKRDTRMGIKDILDALYMGARNTISTAAILICVGIIIGVVAITGVAITFSGVVMDLSYGILFFAIILVMLASLVLGMGLPVTASYIMLAVLAGPALTQMGVSLLAAHMIIFWYSQDANVTPPVCLAAFSAAGVASSKPMQTGFTSWKLAKGLYIIPFLFAYTPLLFEGPVIEVIITAASALFGLFGFTVCWEGYLLRKMNIGERAITVLATILLFWPIDLYKVFGFLILATMYLIQRVSLKKQASEIAAHSSL
ncbi:MAG: TRAP transporter permease [Deltaproteobacteria bacterium]|nr:TRAP transporter permease [Deltaproteobacteria bacterium]